ncbi:hypothetical protein VHEMI10739 [[Torrubiella] hemipterigena]|uniref:Helicase ATP-binding domain-containing protein n=1 Tax=[Torrubiella] hemipterigena TaxID=1531966 RepID=A0A0A1TSR4_9HYPO|nr:hypothetical protein VHEMI10739 [[Torrubiella] hemipterigena]
MSKLVQHCYTPPSEIENVARFFAVSRQALLNGVQLPGTNKILRPYQLEAIFKAVQKVSAHHGSESSDGALICDETGLGKSYVILGVQTMTRLAYLVLQHRSQNPSSHNSDKVIDLETTDQPCPSGEYFGIECSCVPGSLSAAFARTLNGGATIMLSPPHLVGESCGKSAQYFANNISGEDVLCETVVYGKAGALWLCEANSETGYVEREAIDVHNIKAIMPGNMSFSSSPRTRRYDWESLDELTKACGCQPVVNSPVPRLSGNCARTLIIMSTAAFTRRSFGTTFSTTVVAGDTEVRLLRSCWASLVFADESHLIVERESLFWMGMRQLQSINRRYPRKASFCFTTATPYLKSPKSISGPLSVLRSKQEGMLDNLERRFRQAIRSNQPDTQNLIDEIAKFSLGIMIARKTGSIVFGMPIEVGISDVPIRDVRVDIPPELDTTLQPVLDQLRQKSGNQCNRAVYFYYAATMMPAIATAAAKMPDPSRYEILAAEVQEAWERGLSDPMRRFITHCSRDNWFCRLYEILTQAKVTRRHILIACGTPGLAAHVAICLKHEASVKDYYQVHYISSNSAGGALRRSETIATIAAEARQSKQPHVIVGTAELFGTGIDNLVFCNYLIVIGDIEGRSSMKQVIGRVNRGHQTLPVLVYHLQSSHTIHTRVREKRKITAEILFKTRDPCL